MGPESSRGLRAGCFSFLPDSGLSHSPHQLQTLKGTPRQQLPQEEQCLHTHMGPVCKEGPVHGQHLHLEGSRTPAGVGRAPGSCSDCLNPGPSLTTVLRTPGQARAWEHP